MAEQSKDTVAIEASDQWLRELSEFIVEANKNTWAADGGEVQPERPGFKELEYQNGLWRLRDSYTGYFRAPGTTTVYYKGQPAWTMQYGGHGLTEGHEEGVKVTFAFLKQALMCVTPELPFRGPKEYTETDKQYTFQLLHGDITDGLWREEITESGISTFTQTGLVGIIIHRNSNKQPLFPWKL